MKIHTAFATALFTLAGFTAGGCGDSGGTENIDVEGCEHLQEGPPTAVTAGAAADATAPAVAIDHTRYDVTMPGTGAARTGFVKFASPAAHAYVFFLGKNVTLAAQDSAGAPVAFTSTATSSTQCTDIQGRYTLNLGVGTYFLKLGPTDQALVGVVAEEDPAK